MKPVLTASEMRLCDERTIKEFGITGHALMETAARGAEKILALNAKIKKKHILILCGKGNNGGDGFAMGRILKKDGARVTIGLAGKASDLHGDALANHNRAVENKITIVEDASKDLIDAGEWDIIIDALLGTGSKLPLHKKYTELIEAANNYNCLKFSIDIPTGIDADTGAKPGMAFRADVTATMAAMKRGLLFRDGRKYAGIVSVIDIGTPPELLNSKKYDVRLIEEGDVAARLPKRELDANKYSVGKVFLLCGSRGMTGAAEMSSRAAMRAGAGISILAVPRNLQNVLAAKLTETMTVPVTGTKEWSINDPDLDDLGKYTEWGNAYVVGPGLSKHEATSNTVRNFIQAIKAPCVLDADGIGAYTEHLDEIIKAPHPLILTPHYGELARLVGMDRIEIEKNPIETAKNVARRLKCVLVLKGAPTVIGSPDGVVFVNTTGNPGMATAGSGDVLSGIIGALLAQGCAPLDAAICGVYLHGIAGDLAALAFTQHAMIATDIINFIPDVFKQFDLNTHNIGHER